jgi:hypothetical protein
MLLACYNHLHPVFEAKKNFVYKNDEDSNLNIWRWWSTLVNLQRSFINWELLKFQGYQKDAKDIKLHFAMVEKTLNYVPNRWLFS